MCAGLLRNTRTPRNKQRLTLKHGVTLHQEEKLKRLVRLVSDRHGFSQEDYEEALENALADPVRALTCFTALARQVDLHSI